MWLFKRTERLTPEVLDFLADANDVAASQIRRNPNRSPAQESDAKAIDDQSAGFRRRAAKARKKQS